MASSALQNEYVPTDVSAPGETLADLLEERGMSQAELARRTGRTPKTINEIVQGKAQITGVTAILLERALGVPAAFWLTREAHYRENLARREQSASLDAEGSWLKEVGYPALAKLGWVPRAATRAQKVEALLSFFGVSSVTAWRASYAEGVAFRMGRAAVKAGRVSAWLRQGERLALEMNCAPYNREAFRTLLEALRPLTAERDPERCLRELQSRCAEVGVAVVFVPNLPGCPANGAARWLGERAVIQLSLRYKWADILWFTFFHEAAHILLHRKRDLFIEGVGLTGGAEDEANRFAADVLIPGQSARRLSELKSRLSVERFASELGIGAGIVVGRLQHEGRIPHSHLNNLRWRYEFKGG